ncbi:Trehalose transport system permease protein SugA [Candidatus Calditenuaceae archaeon HR02]|nr:Trehalose transport system permease protein SugA [Candidatus Calditenuaceae archaeon HR02]
MAKPRITTKFLFILPAIITILTIVVFPLLFNIYLSFHNWQLRFRGSLPQFVGNDNYLKALSDIRFQNSLEKTFYLLIGAVPMELFFGFLLALLLWEPFRGRRIISVFILFPLALSDAVVGLIWGLTLVPTYGPFDYFMRSLRLWQLLGFEKPVSLTVSFPMETIIAADVWQWTPFFFIVLLAALAAVPTDYIEAAEIDGASQIQVIRFILLPTLKPIIGITVMIRLMDIFKSFGVPYILTKGGPGFESEVVSLYIFNQALQFLNITYAATLTLLVIIIVTLLLTAFMRVYRLRF